MQLMWLEMWQFVQKFKKGYIVMEKSIIPVHRLQ